MAEGMEAGACWCEFDPPEFWDRRVRTARKSHTCCECGLKITQGERYEYIFGRWDGCVETFKTCLPCGQIRLDFCAPYTMLRETLLDLLGTDYLTGEEGEG